MYPDPLVSATSSNSSIPHGPKTSTLRLITVLQSSELSVIEDYNPSSVINGISRVGGLWTFVAGFFAAIFGTSMMRVLFREWTQYISCRLPANLNDVDLKPLSVFGLVHRFQKTGLREGFEIKYPKMKEELSCSDSDRGLLHMIHDQLLDISVVNGKKTCAKDEGEEDEVVSLHHERNESDDAIASA